MVNDYEKESIDIQVHVPDGGDLFREEDGIGVVEILLILVVLITLVIIFREQLSALVSNIFESINSKSETIYR